MAGSRSALLLWKLMDFDQLTNCQIDSTDQGRKHRTSLVVGSRNLHNCCLAEAHLQLYPVEASEKVHLYQDSQDL